MTAIDKLKSLLAKDALNPDSKYKPNLLNSQRFARLSAQARGAGAEGGKLGDASQRGLKQSEKKKKTKKRHRSKAPQASPKKGTKKELYHGTERQAGNYPALGTDSGKKSGKRFAKLFREIKQSKESVDDEEAYLTAMGKIPRQRTISPEAYDKLTEEQKLQFFNPHKTYDSDDKHKSINKLKALLDDKHKSINKLKYLLAKEGESNSGEKSHKEDSEAKEKETETPENFDKRPFYPRIRREFYDPEDKDPF